MSCLPCMSPKRSSISAPTTAAMKLNDGGRNEVGNENRFSSGAPASLHSDSLVRRAITEIPAVAAAPAHGEDVVDGDEEASARPSTLLRRTVTELPPIVSDNPVLEERLSTSTIRPLSVRFTNELADKHGLTRWKKTALAVTGSQKLALGAKQLRRSDSRIAGTIERQQELERANLDDGLSGYDEDGVNLLERRLEKMGLKTVKMGDDAPEVPCPQLVRDTCVAHVLSKEDEFGIFFEAGSGEFERYCREMSMSRTWGDELTLRACADSFQVPIHVVQSTVENWYLVYEPSKELASSRAKEDDSKKKSKRLFVSYISPVHYNAVVPR